MASENESNDEVKRQDQAPTFGTLIEGPTTTLEDEEEVLNLHPESGDLFPVEETMPEIVESEEGDMPTPDRKAAKSDGSQSQNRPTNANPTRKDESPTGVRDTSQSQNTAIGTKPKQSPANMTPQSGDSPTKTDATGNWKKARVAFSRYQNTAIGKKPKQNDGIGVGTFWLNGEKNTRR